MGSIGEQHLGGALQARCGLGGRRGSRPGYENVHIAAECGGDGHRLGCDGIELGVGMLGYHQNGHQSPPASVLSFCTSSATLPTLTPDWRVGGSAVRSTFTRGAISTPMSAGFFTSSGFFFAFIMFGSEA